MQISAPRGTNDVLPDQAPAWRALERAIERLCAQYGYRELRPPIFEHTELFQRGVGEATDIVEKEMYTFEDRGGRSVTLRPEITAGLVRAYLEHNLHQGPQPTKLWSIGPGFRYEKPQAGRYRQFTQWDVEVFGSLNPAVDAEVIQMGIELAGRLGLEGLVVRLNSIGCPRCRPAYREALKAYYRPHLAELCENCRSRFERNPLRLLDCKEDRRFVAGAPRTVDHLCDECREHFAAVQGHLRRLGVAFEVDPGIVRGLDYYTKTVFEVTYPPLGAQSTVWGGGRYDGLIEELGGPSTPGVGFAMGMERMLLTLEKSGRRLAAPEGLDVFVAPLSPAAGDAALELLYALRRAGLAADTDYLGRSLKSQMKLADRLGARHAALIGDDELAAGTVSLRDMATGEQRSVPRGELAALLRAELGPPAGGRD